MPTDPDTGGKTVVVQRVDGTTVALPLLSPSNFVALADRIKARKKATLEHNLAVAGITGDAAFTKLEAFDAQEVNRADVLQYILTDDGQVQAIAGAMRRLDPTATEAHVDGLVFDTASAGRDTMLKVAGRLAGLNMDGKAAKKKEGEAPPDPTTAGASSAPSAAT
jgi:hypothetical protein